MLTLLSLAYHQDANYQFIFYLYQFPHNPHIIPCLQICWSIDQLFDGVAVVHGKFSLEKRLLRLWIDYEQTQRFVRWQERNIRFAGTTFVANIFGCFAAVGVFDVKMFQLKCRQKIIIFYFAKRILCTIKKWPNVSIVPMWDLAGKKKIDGLVPTFWKN